MKGKVALYSLGIGILALGGAIFNHLAYGKPILLERLPMILLISPVLGFFLWLRWDWAAERGRKVRAERKREGDSR